MAFVSITFQKIVFKPFRQAVRCLLKRYNKIIHVIGNHLWSIVIRQAGNVDVIYSKKKSAKKTLNNTDPSIECCGAPNIISNQVL